MAQCGACSNSIGAVLKQDAHVVAYERRVLQVPKHNLQVYGKELLAIIHALIL